MKKSILGIASAATLLLPVLALAQVGTPPPSINLDLITLGNNIANAAWIIFTIIAVVMFIIAGILFLTARGNPEQVGQARNAFLWGVVGIVVAILAFTIITLTASVVSTGQ